MKTKEKKWQPSHAWLSLGDEFHDPVYAANFPKCQLRFRNQQAAQDIGLDHLTPHEWHDHFCRFKPLEGTLQTALALRYHGHQFLHYNPDLGDGRGFLFAQMFDSSGRLLDLGSKGSGQTPWSRRGDGRLTLKGAVRELLATSYLQAHGVNTSRTFSIFETGESLIRHDEPSPTRSAVLTRLSHSHVRIGTFQRLAYLQKKIAMEKLLDYCLHYHYPAPANAENKVSHFFKMVCENVAKTTAQWMAIGFVHGVLNTDNINITGESFDYGPYRFLPYYNDAFTAAYFDHNGLYAYGQQPRVLLWNLEQLEKSLYLLQPDKKIYAAGYQTFETVFNQSTYRLFVQRLGVTPIRSESAGEKLCFAVIHFLKTSKMPFEHFFFDWYGGLQRQTQVLSGPHKNYYQSQAFQNVLEILKNFTPTDKNLPNYFDRQEPIYLYIDKIEQVWQHIDEKDDWDPLYNLLNEMQNIPRTLNI